MIFFNFKGEREKCSLKILLYKKSSEEPKKILTLFSKSI